VNALSQLPTKYGLPIPTDPGLTGMPTFSTLANACQAGVDAEIADATVRQTAEGHLQRRPDPGVHEPPAGLAERASPGVRNLRLM
jgi:hypothetical protein